ncbi:hypothetical protein RZS08_34680, partial [Arthrospira platensis SPKY1]|nr:hypothetical protein [Arthrospira platensis SPKY1]
MPHPGRGWPGHGHAAPGPLPDPDHVQAQQHQRPAARVQAPDQQPGNSPDEHARQQGLEHIPPHLVPVQSPHQGRGHHVDQ